MPNVTESPVLLIVGTRPEGIKMAPVYHALVRAGIPTIVCSTMQHDQLLTEVLDLFDIIPDSALKIMRPKQDLFYLTQAVLQKTKELFLKENPCMVLVQGDTTSSMAAALAAFYLHIPVGHIEAGLRTDDIHTPFPEEMNRRVISMVSKYHFAPTPSAVANLLAHGVHRDQIFCTGNTVVDALYIVREKIASKKIFIREDIKNIIALARNKGHQIGLITLHRRESFNGPLETILKTIKDWIQHHPDTTWFYPYHPNPHVVETIQAVGLADMPNLYLCEPVAYKELVYILDAAHLVLTDSGGIQEEAVSLGKPVLVLREKTERMEGVLAGAARVVGSNPEAIREGLEWAQNYHHESLNSVSDIYGDGHAAEKIVAFIQSRFDDLQRKPETQTMPEPITMQPAIKDTDVKQVSILGLGYIGLPTAIVAAESGLNVVGFDIDVERVASINNGNPIIHEPEAYEKLQFVLGSGAFRATTQIEPADFFIIAVPTPITADKKADMSYVYAATDSIITVLKHDDTIIIESTIPVGATQKVGHYIQEKTGLRSGVDFFIAHCPERVLPGHIFYELITNDRIIGGINKESVEQAKQFYKPFVSGTLYLTDAKTAEMVKLVENSSRDAQLAFAHQVASMAYSIGLNPYEIIELANKHPRVKILRPTVGVGGHCIAIDPWFLVESFPGQSDFIKAARITNDAKPHEVVNCIQQTVHTWRKNNIGICKVLLLGVSYKPNVEDLRESPALSIAQQLSQDGTMQTFIADPHVDQHILDALFGERVVNIIDGIQKADIVVFLVAHDRFKVIDRKLLDHKQIIDYCGVLYQTSALGNADEEHYWPTPGMMDFFIVNQVQGESE